MTADTVLPRRVLCMDGGGVMSLLALETIKRIEAARPGFLNSIDIFAGTSAGGINALLLAAAEDPADMLETCVSLWTEVPIYATSVARSVAAVVGQAAFQSNHVLGCFLDEKLGTRRLRDLDRFVLVPTFKAYRSGPDQAWHPRLFHNFPSAGPEFLDELARDVAMRTAAFPVSFPIYQGYIDAGIYANNPSMCVLAQVLCEARTYHQEEDALQQVAILSLGAGTEPRGVSSKHGDWGWQQWLLNPSQPLAFVEAVLDSSPLVVDFQCVEVLGRRGYFRHNPILDEARHARHKHAPTPSAVATVRQLATDIGDQTDLTNLFDWLDTSNWAKPGSYHATHHRKKESQLK